MVHVVVVVGAIGGICGENSTDEGFSGVERTIEAVGRGLAVGEGAEVTGKTVIGTNVGCRGAGGDQFGGGAANGIGL